MKDGDSGSEDYTISSDLPARIRATKNYEELVSLLLDELIKAERPSYCATLSVHRERVAEAAVDWKTPMERYPENEKLRL